MHHLLFDGSTALFNFGLGFGLITVFDNVFENVESAWMQEINSLAIEERRGVELEDIIFPVVELFEWVVGERYLEGVFEVVLDFFAQSAEVVLQRAVLLLFFLMHIISILKVVTIGVTKMRNLLATFYVRKNVVISEQIT